MMILIFGGLLVSASVSDLRRAKVSDRYWGLIFLLSFWSLLENPDINMLTHIGGFFIVSVPLCIIALVIPRAFGGADIKMMAVCGACLGTKMIVYAFVLGLFLAAGPCVFVLMQKQGKINHIPLVPFWSVSIVFVILFVI